MNQISSTGLIEFKGATSLSIREAHFDDYDGIATLLKQQKLRCEGRAEWMDLWLESELYRESGGRWPIGWVIEVGAGEIVGTLSNIPLKYSYGGRSLKAAASRAWAVDERYRAYSLTLFFRFASQPGVDLYLSTTTGRKSAAVCSSFNWSRPPVGRWDCSGFWITDYSGFLRTCLRMAVSRGHRRSQYANTSAFAGKNIVSSSTLAKGRTNVEVGFANTFGDGFDEFWSSLKSEKPHVLLNVRSARGLNGLFKHALLQNRLWIVVAREAGRILGYGIFKRSDQPELGLKRMLVVDLQTLSGDQIVCSAIFRKALERCRAEGIHTLENRGCWLESAEYLGYSAPFHRNLKACSYFYKPASPRLRSELEDPSCWGPTGLDGDSGLGS